MATALITGANRGIGLALAQQLTRRGDHVIAAVRTPSQELTQLPGVRVEVGIDVSNADDVQDLARRLEGVPIDLLINNAGILRAESLDHLDFESILEQFKINALGPLRVTAALRANLQPGAKVGIVTSRMGSIADNSSGSRYGYRMSKAAVNMAGVSLARDLAPQGVAVALLHPGFVRTEMTGGHGMIDPPESAAGLLARLDALTLETSGGFWHCNGEPLPW
jgi:NAD(P)-dependent dehydrogenase (short-subunit alcohol dehydrogenase family)